LKRLRRFSLFAAVALATLSPLTAEPISQLHPSNYVNDFAGVLDAATVTRLNALAQQVDEKAKAQIAVVTVKSTDGQDIVGYSVDLYQKWGIGKKGIDRGVLILLAVQDRKYWTTVGYGLEPILPDGKVGGFGREAVPLLRAGDYAGAVSLMTVRVAQVIASDAGVTLEGVQAPAAQRAPSDQPDGGVIGIVIALVVVGFFILMIKALSKAGGRGGGRPRGGGSGFMSGLLWGILINSMTSRGGGGSSWGGGGWGGGGFGGGGGGFGGFGGGSTGGGGAGGSW
jgi:uncharacterized protein